MRITVIGCGSIGKRHIGNLQAIGAQDVVACDIRPDRLQEVKERFGIAQTYQNYWDAISDDADVVVVCTPPKFHISLATAAAEKGCHLLVEKPLSNSLDGVDRLIELCVRRGLVLMTAYNMRFWAPIVKIKALLDEGRIGRVLSARVGMSGYLPDFHPWESPSEFFMFDGELGGGVILDASHAIDFTRWFLGEVAAVSCFNDKISDIEMDADDIALLLLRFESGALVDMHLDLLGRAPRKSCELIGEDGTILWETTTNEVKLYEVETREWGVFDCDVDYNDVYVAEMQHFLECVREGRQPLIDGSDGKRTLEVVLAAIQSSQEGRVIAL